MEPETFLDGRVTQWCGDVRACLAAMPADSIDCVVTSPPYWGLRDYGTARWDGGDPSCDHRSPTMREGRNEKRPKLARSAATNSYQLKLAHNSSCGKCGAVKVDEQIGLEMSLSEHLAVMVDVFGAVRRVLKPSGSLWINYGDCYATSPNGRSAAATKAAGNDDRTFRDKPFSTIGGVLKAKDLCMVPNRLAIALQESGWWVRSEIVWGKTNPMPDSSGRYRPSTAHEKIWLLTKTGKSFYNSEAVARRRITSNDTKKPDNWNTAEGAHGSFHPNGREKGERIDKQRGHSRRHQGFNDRWDQMERADQVANGRLLRNYEPAELDVWPMAPHPFPESHFATFPPELAERCIKAGCPPGGTVLDPFGGAGTTAMVAVSLEHTATLIELNPEYCRLARARIESAFMGKEEGARHMVRQLGKTEHAGPLFGGSE